MSPCFNDDNCTSDIQVYETSECACLQCYKLATPFRTENNLSHKLQQRTQFKFREPALVVYLSISGCYNQFRRINIINIRIVGDLVLQNVDKTE